MISSGMPPRSKSTRSLEHSDYKELCREVAGATLYPSAAAQTANGPGGLNPSSAN